MKNAVQPGNVLTMIAGNGGVLSGTLQIVGAIIGVAATSAAQGHEYELQTGGVWELPKTPAQAWAAGDKVYWDATNNVATTTSSTNTLIGVAIRSAANPSGAGVVRLNTSF